ncbi:MAG TPA: TRAP transporter small permease subunit [Gammaproteobacteria bacterium]|nr:TRAP transporter small permease subunit [Gammaproteobacteria bacterium]
MKGLLAIARAIDTLNEWVGRIVYWLGLLMIALGVYNAVVRYVGAWIGENFSSNAYLEGQWYLFGIMFMLGAAYTLRHDGHVRVDVLYATLSPRAKAWVNLLGSIALLIPFCALALYLCYDWIKFSWAIHETSSNPGGLPRYPIKTVVPVALVLLMLQGISLAIHSAAVLTGDETSPTEEADEEIKPL